MAFLRQVSRALDDEHRTNLELLGRIEQAFARASQAGMATDPDLVRLAGSFSRQLEQDIGRHFDFEERELFPRMAEAGDGDMATLLGEEHDAIRELAAELLPLARAAAKGGLAIDGWDTFRRSSLEMVDRQVAHIQKETMALLPMLDDLLDEETDRNLAFAYVSD